LRGGALSGTLASTFPALFVSSSRRNEPVPGGIRIAANLHSPPAFIVIARTKRTEMPDRHRPWL